MKKVALIVAGGKGVRMQSEIPKQFLLLNKEIDIFIHDSDHTYKNMMFEYDISWPHIKKGGLLISDDVESSNAFYDFSIKKDLKPILFFQDLNQKTFLGILQKPI